jgi:hypothetical protein
MATAMATASGIARIYEGVPIHARGFALAAVHDSWWRPPRHGVWAADQHVSNAWRHPGYPRHVLWKPEESLVVIARLAKSTPTVGEVLHLGRVALGPTVTPSQIASYPLSLRLPMRCPGPLPFTLPPGNFRVRRLWPAPGAAPHIEFVERVPIELRISGTSDRRGLRLYAECFIGRVHQNRRKRPRSLIYTGDGRHVRIAPSLQEAKRFTARLMDCLLGFAYRLQNIGLEIDHRSLPGRQLGRVQICKDIDDVEFAIRLPQPGGTQSYVGSYVLP